MKAEIGFVWDSFTGSDPGTKEPDRLRLTVTAETPTEGATLRIFKRRMGIQDTVLDGMYGQLIIEEPVKPSGILPEGEAR